MIKLYFDLFSIQSLKKNNSRLQFKKQVKIQENIYFKVSKLCSVREKCDSVREKCDLNN